MFDTRLPTKTDQDLFTYLEQVLEKYKLRFPEVTYNILTHPSEAASGEITTNLAVTTVDDLYGEDVPAELANGFKQPHTDLDIDPTVSSIFTSAVVNAKIKFVARSRELSKYGRDVKQRIEFKFINYQLERQGIFEVSPGDTFIWKDHKYKVQTYTLSGRWYDTDYFLYSNAQATLNQFGS